MPPMIRKPGRLLWVGLIPLVVVMLTGGTATGTPTVAEQGKKKINPKLKPYRVGAVLALTGAFSGTDQDSAAGLRATVREINANGGVNGHRLVYRIIDNGSDTAKAALAAQAVVDQFDPQVMIPDIPCRFALSALPIAKRENIPTFTGCDNGVPSNPSEYPLNFSTFPPASVLGVPLVAALRHATKLKSGSIGFLHSNDVAGESLVSPVRRAASVRGYQWAGDQAFAVGTPDVTVQLANLRRAGADAVILWGQVGDAGNVMRSMRDLAWDAHVVGGTGTTSATLVDEIPEQLRGKFHALVTANSIRKPNATTPPAWINNYLRPASSKVQTLSVVGAVHDGLTYWKWAAERTKSINPNRIRQELEKLNQLPRNQWPSGLQLTANPMYSSTQHGLLNANLNRAWGVMRPSRNIMGTYEGEVFTCFCSVPG